MYYAYLQGIYFIVNAFLAGLIAYKCWASWKNSGSTAVRYLSFTAITLTIDWLVEGIPLLFFPHLQTLVAFSIVILGTLLIQLTISFLTAVIITAAVPQIPIQLATIPFIVGLVSTFFHAVTFRPAVYTELGFVSVPFNTFGEILSIFTVLSIVTMSGFYFLKQHQQMIFNIRSLLIGIGIFLVGATGPIAYNASEPVLFHILNSLTVVGMILNVVGAYVRR